ncbi:MAG: DUF1772 domain-containing protein [Thermomicrobiales bacterium]|nr:DUF1772 domain-containing protein [Thermomicrobiales bacterium]MCO5225895.1 DUF1772 domain-containing protein [Thermomicrobiales bacterium]
MVNTISQPKLVPLTTLVWVSLGLVGLMAGFFYAYSASVMVGLKEVSDTTFIETMQWINATVRNVWFGPAFFGSLIVTGVTAVIAYVAGARKVAAWMIAACALYAVAFFITMGVSVPLNYELRDAGDVAAIADPAAVRADYEGSWVRWNNARTVVSTASLLAVGGAMRALGRSSDR